MSTLSLSAMATNSAQNVRQRMFGSTPCINTMSRSLPGGRQWVIRIAGHTSSRVTPST